MHNCIPELTYPTDSNRIDRGVCTMIVSVRHNWPERAGFLISRPEGLDTYTFLHFLTPVKLLINGQIQSVKAGGCIFYRPGTPQWFQSETSLVHNWAHFQPELGELLKEYDLPADQLLYPKESEFISEIFRILEAEFLADRPYRNRRLQCQTDDFLIRLSRTVKEDASQHVSRTDSERMLTVSNHILSHPEQQWTVSRMAQLLPLSPSRFHAVYKNTFGTSPMKDLIMARVIRAKSILLVEKDWTLNRVAEHSGFADTYHFIRQFKTVTGLTPGAWRKKRGNRAIQDP